MTINSSFLYESGDAGVNDPSYGGIIPIIVIKDNK